MKPCDISVGSCLQRAFLWTVALSFLLSGNLIAIANENLVSVDFQSQWDTKRVLENPDKGWYHHLHDNGVYRYDITDDSLFDAFPGMDHIYIRIAWSFLEPEEGKYDWHLIDEVIDKYVPRGYGIAFRITCKERRGYPEAAGQLVEGVHYATPYWVRKAGCKGHESIGRGTEALAWSPDWDDPIFLEKLENFHRVFAKRYEKQPWVRFIEVGSIGDYGEGHTNASTKITPDVNEVKSNLDVYRRCYQHARLLTSDDLLYWHKPDDEVQALYDYAVAHGFSISDESPMVGWYIKTCLDTWSVSHPHFFDPLYKDRPTKLELQHYSIVKRDHWLGKNGADTLPGLGVSGADIFRGAIRTMHATYIGYHGFAEEFLSENPDLAGELLNLCGYWYFPVRAQYPRSLRTGTNQLTIAWLNKGVAPAYKDYSLILWLESKDTGKSVVVTVPDAGNRKWLPDIETESTYSFKLPKDLPTGSYHLKCKLVDRHSEPARDIQVGLQRSTLDERQFLTLGNVEVQSLPAIPYGAVYFRKSNPPAEDWERDYKQAAADGMNCFRHWFLWSAIEVAPGEYDWADYDRQLDLAAKYGIKTIIADILATAPEWAFRKYPHAQVESANGSKAASRYTPACAVGGAPGLCLDNEEVKHQAENFLRAMVTRYRNHPGLGGYDVWNELNMNGGSGGCYCEASAQKFREWLKVKYGSLTALNKAWYRYSYASWDDVQIPRTNDPYPDSMDWVLFRIDNAVRLFKWRVDLIRSLDPRHPVTSHAIPLGVIEEIGPRTYPVFQVGKLVDIYGYSGGCNHDERTRLRWLHWCKMDMTRSASQGKPFWCAEMPAGFSWRWPLLELDRGRMTTAQDVCLYSMMHFAGGAQGVFSPRWRPLLDGRFAGYFGFYDLDGSPTERASAGGQLAQWANAPEQHGLFQAKPVQGDIGILLVPESQIHCYAKHDSTDFYYQSVIGAYQAFLFSNIQPDFVAIDDLGPQHDLLYLPFPVMLPEATATKLRAWVRQGGKLICEGCPAYFGDRGRAGEQQPNYKLDQLFGVKQEWVQFTPDLLNNLTVQLKQGSRFKGGIYLQSYTPTTGQAQGTYKDERIAVVDSRFGKGKTRLIGTFPGYAYNRSQDAQTKQFFSDLLKWAGKTQHVTSSDERIIARLHVKGQSRYLWVVNAAREDIQVELGISKQWGSFKKYHLIRGEAKPTIQGSVLSLSIPARQVLILELR